MKAKAYVLRLSVAAVVVAASVLPAQAQVVDDFLCSTFSFRCADPTPPPAPVVAPEPAVAPEPVKKVKHRKKAKVAKAKAESAPAEPAPEPAPK